MAMLYPMMVRLNGRPCVVIGGGKVAERKVSALLEAQAEVTVISPDFTPRLVQWIEQKRIRGIARPYAHQDLKGAFLVIAATNVEEVNLAVYEEARQNHQLINVVGHPELSDFMNPAMVRRGKLQIAVSTSGAAPFLTRSIRDELVQRYGEEYALYTEFLEQFRNKLRNHEKCANKRKEIYDHILDMDVPHIIRGGEFEMFREEVFAMFEDDGG